MDVLIIGGTGLISTGIVKALAQDGANVTVYNRGKTDNRLPENVAVIRGDRNDEAAFAAAFADRRFDAAIDMICFTPEQAACDIRVFAGKAGHFVFCSTVCAYGNTQTDLPTRESAPCRPHSGYGINKLKCEDLFMQCHARGDMPVTIFRPSHTFGPGGGIINNLGWNADFVDRLRKHKPIVISGDGHGLWQSAYADDVGAGFAKSLGRRATFGEIYNIVGPECFTWDQYTRRVAAAIGAPEPRIVHVPTDALLAIAPERFAALAEIFRYHGVYGNDKILRDVPEYRPGRTPFEEGVRRTLAWMERHGKVSAAETDSVEDSLAAWWESSVETARRELAPAKGREAKA